MITINPDVLHYQNSGLIYYTLVFGKAGEKILSSASARSVKAE